MVENVEITEELFLCAGMLKVPGLMPPRCNMFDTPGVPHDFQLSSRLSADEVRAPQPFLLPLQLL